MVMVAEQVTDTRLLIQELNGRSDGGVLHQCRSSLLLPFISVPFSCIPSHPSPC